jgi:hypothetical protein
MPKFKRGHVKVRRKAARVTTSAAGNLQQPPRPTAVDSVGSGGETDLYWTDVDTEEQSVLINNTPKTQEGWTAVCAL